MGRAFSVSVFVLTAGCLNEPTLATITPDYGYFDSDGCVEVLLSGHHLGTDATATIGGVPIIDFTAATEDPAREDYAQDVGFDYTGLVPPGPDGGGVWVDVEMEVDGETLKIDEGFYYRTCPNNFVVDYPTVPYVPPGYDYYSPTPDYTVDTSVDIDLQGCGLDAATVTVEYTNVADDTVTSVPLVQSCQFASGTADIPDSLPPGNYILEVVKGADRIRLSPFRCGVPYTLTYYQYTYNYYTTPAECPFDITIGGAR
jgi:hypothetical protein